MLNRAGVLAARTAVNWAFRFGRLVGGRARRVHVLLPATAGSLGDQAVLCGLAELTRSAGLDAPVQVTIRDWISHECPGAPESVRIAIEDNGPRSGLSVARMLRDCSQLIILGTDIIEGNYSRSHVCNLVRLSNTAARLGVATHICGFSFSSSPNPDAVRSLRQLDRRVRCTTRDSVSALRFQEHVGRSADVVADPAFIMQPRLTSPGAVVATDWVRRRRAAGDIVLGVNENAIARRTTPRKMHEAYVAALSQILDCRAASVLLLPHDLRADQSDIPPLREVQHQLEGQFPGRSHLLDAPVDAWDVKYLAGECDLIISGRLHLTIAALSQGTPAVGVEYHGKFLGIFSALGLEGLLLTPAEVLDEGRLGSTVLSALDRLPELRDRLAGSRPSVEQGVARLAATLPRPSGNQAPDSFTRK